MNPIRSKAATSSHVLAIPYPGRGHINPMLNLCKSLGSKSDDHDLLITFVVTEEWLQIIGSEPKPHNIHFTSIPNVLPSENIRGADVVAFMEAVWTKLESPFEQLMDRLQPPPTIILADTFLSWAISFGNRRNIPVASFWPMSATIFLVFQHYNLRHHKGHLPLELEKGDERIDYIPGVPPTRLLDLPVTLIRSDRQPILEGILTGFSWLPKAQYLLLSSMYELESLAIDVLKAEFSFPVYSIGPAIPHFKLQNKSTSTPSNGDEPGYFQWLDSQPSNSVLYVSLGSFAQVSTAQIDEIAAGLHDSGVRFLWVARTETSRLKLDVGAYSNRGLLMPWCDQLRVLSHPSIGGFWSHCGWNSVQEGLFSGVPFLTFPLIADQTLNSKLIVEDWKTGWRLKKENSGKEILVTRAEITKLVQKFMDLESDEGKEMRRRAKEVQELCQLAVARDGSSESNIKAFINNITLSL